MEKPVFEAHHALAGDANRERAANPTALADIAPMITIYFVFKDKRIAHPAEFVNEFQIFFEDLAIFSEEHPRENPAMRTVQAAPENGFFKKG